jgi:hypothetical protein
METKTEFFLQLFVYASNMEFDRSLLVSFGDETYRPPETTSLLLYSLYGE